MASTSGDAGGRCSSGGDRGEKRTTVYLQPATENHVPACSPRQSPHATVVTIDQTRKAVGADLYAAWYPIGERPTVNVSTSREGANLLGAVTEYGETTVLECGGSFIDEVTIRFLEHLQAEFSERLVVFLD